MRLESATLSLAGCLLILPQTSCSSRSPIETRVSRSAVSIDAVEPPRRSILDDSDESRVLDAGGGPAPEGTTESGSHRPNAHIHEVASHLATAEIEPAHHETAATTQIEPVLVPRLQGSGVGAPTPGALDFRLVDVTFASKIFGPGDYVPRSGRRFRPGERILLYGEFADFAEEAVSPTERRRRFSGTLRLLDPNGDMLDSLDFISQNAGSSRSAASEDTVNFWARYTLATDLPVGRYELHIVGRDHVASKESRVALAVRVDQDENQRTPENELGDDLPLVDSPMRAYGEPENRAEIPSQPSLKRRAVPMSRPRKNTDDSP